jgi:Tol biopolymer transport system component
MKSLIPLAGCVGALVIAGGGSAGAATPVATVLVSVSSSGRQGNHDSFAAGISAHGRYVAFLSWATNLVPGDTNGRLDVFRRNRSTGATIRVSVSSSGAQARCSDPWGCSGPASMSADGRFVAFVSSAGNLVAGDTNHLPDVFVHDCVTGRTTRVSVGRGGRQGNGASGFAAISADGRFVAFTSAAWNLVGRDTNGTSDVFVHDRSTGRTRLVSVSSVGVEGNRDSEGPAISAHGRVVAFTSDASNLVVGDTNHIADVFVHDRDTGRTTRVSVSSGGVQAAGFPTGTGSNSPAISADGRYVAFHSEAQNLVRHDTNDTFDIFVRDRRLGTTLRVNVSSNGSQANAETLGSPVISPDGRLVAFTSLATNLVPGDANSITDAFIHDRATGRTILASVSSNGTQGNDSSSPAAFSPHDRLLALSSYASNLVPGDTNSTSDAFLRGIGPW